MNQRIVCVFAAAFVAMFSHYTLAQTDTTFTYQGELHANGSPANGAYNMEFSLWDAVSGGNQIGITDEHNGVPVANGRFTVELDFGVSAFDNSDRWLEISVNGDTLDPRHPITRSPYSIQTRGIFVDDNHNVGIGTTIPEDQLHLQGDAAAFRVQDDDKPDSYSVLRDASPTQSQLQKINDSGGVLIDIDPIPIDGASDAQLRLFRSTNTTGLKRVAFYRGNNTTQTSALIGLDGADSYFQVQGGNVGIGTATPTAKLHVAGTAGVDGVRFPDGTLQTSAARQIVSATVFVDPPNILAGGSMGTLVTIPGVQFGDVVVANPDEMEPAVGIQFITVFAPDQVLIGFLNAGNIDRNPDGNFWRFRIIK